MLSTLGYNPYNNSIIFLLSISIDKVLGQWESYFSVPHKLSWIFCCWYNLFKIAKRYPCSCSLLYGALATTIRTSVNYLQQPIPDRLCGVVAVDVSQTVIHPSQTALGLLQHIWSRHQLNILFKEEIYTSEWSDVLLYIFILAICLGNCQQ